MRSSQLSNHFKFVANQFEINWTLIIQIRMKSIAVEAHCYVIPYTLLCTIARLIVTQVNLFLSQVANKAM
jgi:hypothetical protein